MKKHLLTIAFLPLALLSLVAQERKSLPVDSYEESKKEIEEEQAAEEERAEQLKQAEALGSLRTTSTTTTTNNNGEGGGNTPVDPICTEVNECGECTQTTSGLRLAVDVCPDDNTKECGGGVSVPEDCPCPEGSEGPEGNGNPDNNNGFFTDKDGTISINFEIDASSLTDDDVKEITESVNDIYNKAFEEKGLKFNLNLIRSESPNENDGTFPGTVEETSSRRHWDDTYNLTEGYIGEIGDVINNSLNFVKTVERRSNFLGLTSIGTSILDNNTVAITIAHELGHAFGLQHPWEEGSVVENNADNVKNLMNTDDNEIKELKPSLNGAAGTELTAEQVEKILETLKNQNRDGEDC